MMSDRELIELAAKAAGINGHFGSDESQCNFYIEGEYGESTGIKWNPLDDDGDALRLAVKLGIAIIPLPIYEQIKNSVVSKLYKDSRAVYRGERKSIEEIELYNDDKYAATRRAIVRAAAEIGRSMK